VIKTLQCLKKYGQRLDLEIAQEMGMPLATVVSGLLVWQLPGKSSPAL
jgi:hypothetical protein